MGTSAITAQARGRAILRGHADGAAWNTSADTGQAIPIGRAVAACPPCPVVIPPIPPTPPLEKNIYMTGLFNRENLPIYDSSGNLSSITVSAIGSYQNTYIAKYSDAGIPLWATKISLNTGSLIGPLIVVDTNDTFFVAGFCIPTLPGTLSFYSVGTPTAVINLPISSSNEIWLAKYNAAGEVLWATHLIGDVISSAVVDSDHNVYICGEYRNTLTIYEADDPTTVVGTLAATGTGAASSYLVKYSSVGAYQWGVRIGSTVASSITGASTLYYHASGAVCIAGSYTAALSIYDVPNPSSPAATLPMTNNTEIFVIRYNTSGTYQWATHIGGNLAGDLVNPRLIIDISGSTYICARYSSTIINIYNATGGPVACTAGNSGQEDIFLAKFNTSGIAQWVAVIGGTLRESQVILTVDPGGNIIVAGFTESATVNIYNGATSLNPLPAPSTTKSLANSANYNFVLVKFNSGGQYQWVAYTGQTYNINIAPTVSCDISSNILVAGRFNAAPGPITNIFRAYRASDLVPTLFLMNTISAPSTFFVKYSPDGDPIWIAKTLYGDTPDVDTTFKPWGP